MSTMRYYLKDGTSRTIEADRVYRDGDHIVFATLGVAGGICARIPLALAHGRVELDVDETPDLDAGSHTEDA